MSWNIGGLICGFMVAVAISCILFQCHSLFGVLLGFEVFRLVLFYCFVVFWGDMQRLVGFRLVFLCLEVCVMCVSLALMVRFVKGVGSDYVGVLMLTNCG